MLMKCLHSNFYTKRADNVSFLCISTTYSGIELSKLLFSLVTNQGIKKVQENVVKLFLFGG